MEEVLDNAVQMRIDIHPSKVSLTQQQPSYRLYINDELFSERTYHYTTGSYLTEQLFVSKLTGEYQIRLESLSDFEFKLRNLRCKYGKAEVVDNEVFKL